MRDCWPKSGRERSGTAVQEKFIRGGPFFCRRGAAQMSDNGIRAFFATGGGLPDTRRAPAVALRADDENGKLMPSYNTLKKHKKFFLHERRRDVFGGR